MGCCVSLWEHSAEEQAPLLPPPPSCSPPPYAPPGADPSRCGLFRQACLAVQSQKMDWHIGEFCLTGQPDGELMQICDGGHAALAEYVNAMPAGPVAYTAVKSYLMCQ